jgi:hypothetical protein
VGMATPRSANASQTMPAAVQMPAKEPSGVLTGTRR